MTVYSSTWGGSGGCQVWYTPPNREPNVWRNDTASTDYQVPAGWVSIHPGQSGQHSVARWTSPISGDVLLSGKFGGGDTAVLDAYILHGGTTVWSRMRFTSDEAEALFLSGLPGPPGAAHPAPAAWGIAGRSRALRG